MTTTPPPAAFEPEFVDKLRAIFEDKIVFNRVLGLQIVDLLPDRATGRIEMRDELIGHYAHHRLHGGVISATLDAMGGLAVMAAIGARHMDDAIDARLARFAKLGTLLDELERRIVAGRLAAHGWRQAETADSLRIDRKTLWRKIREWGLEPPP